MKTQNLSQQAKAIDFAVNAKPGVLRAFEALRESITLAEGLDALEKAAVFRLGPEHDWRASIRVTTIKNDAALRAYLDACASSFTMGDAARPAGVTSTRVSLSFMDNTRHPWERYTANVINLKLEALGRDGAVQTTYYGVSRRQLEIAIRMVAPRFGGQEIYQAASKLPLA